MKIAVQLYTVREEAKEDFLKVLEDVKALGFDGVELAGFNQVPVDQVAQKLKDLNLEVMASHVGFKSLDDLETTLRNHEKVGCKNLIIPWSKLESSEDLNVLIHKIKNISPKLKEKGFNLLYHNHAHELVMFEEGTYALDALFQATKGELDAEIDTFWVKKAGLDPITYMESLGERLKFIHVKDMIISENGDKNFAAVGHGEMDIVGILNKAKEMGLEWVVVENDDPEPSGMENIRMSMDYLKSL